MTKSQVQKNMAAALGKNTKMLVDVGTFLTQQSIEMAALMERVEQLEKELGATKEPDESLPRVVDKEMLALALEMLDVLFPFADFDSPVVDREHDTIVWGGNGESILLAGHFQKARAMYKSAQDYLKDCAMK